MHKMNTPQKFDSERQLRTSCPLWQAAAEEEADQQMVSAKQALLGGGATRNLFSYENDFYKYYSYTKNSTQHRFLTLDCSKQMKDLLTAVPISSESSGKIICFAVYY